MGVLKLFGTETVTYSEFFWTPFSAGPLGAAVPPPIGPGQSPGGSSEGEAPENSWDLVI